MTIPEEMALRMALEKLEVVALDVININDLQEAIDLIKMVLVS